jgi:uncharacterized membrane protein
MTILLCATFIFGFKYLFTNDGPGSFEYAAWYYFYITLVVTMFMATLTGILILLWSDNKSDKSFTKNLKFSVNLTWTFFLNTLGTWFIKKSVPIGVETWQQIDPIKLIVGSIIILITTISITIMCTIKNNEDKKELEKLNEEIEDEKQKITELVDSILKRETNE